MSGNETFTETAEACRNCNTSMAPFMSFGPQPIAQNFVAADAGPEAHDDLCYELAPCLCPGCGLMQLQQLPAEDCLFSPSYAYRTTASTRMVHHLEELAGDVASMLHDRRAPFVIEIGCNDGSFLAPLARRGIRHLGIDPATKAAEEARAKGVRVCVDRFTPRKATEIACSEGPADAVIGTNVIAHLRDIRGTAEAVAALLASDGIFIFEAIYLGAILKRTAFDQFYDEHPFTFSALAARHAFAQAGLELVDIRPVPVQGGSMRYAFARRGKRTPSRAVTDLLRREEAIELHDPAAWAAFAERCAQIRNKLRPTIELLRNRDGPVAAYGATAKSATVITYCGLDREVIDCVYDTTPDKIGLLTPYSRIPIRPAGRLPEDTPGHVLLFAWNHLSEIEDRETAFRAKGGRWLHYHPDILVD